MSIKLKRAYEKPEKGDGFRILVERLWPRGVTKEKAEIDLWMKDIAPSSELRKWYGHDVEKWPEFKKRYKQELKDNKELVAELKSRVKKDNVTFVYAAKDEEHNSAVVLKDFVEK
ncbi:MAG TPA: DUF488 domain-containing protein [Pyrinomonadaceae bacterium]|jgi:uncharacterized protein YeaO (DUF488 family)|nr:DUF488 domain-containing protein [Pyrinomonadaceae bacterium]